MTYSLLPIFCTLALVGYSESRQLNLGPHYFKSPSLSPQSQELDKRFSRQEITLYLTPNEMKSLLEAQDSTNEQIEVSKFKVTQENDFQSFNERQKKQFDFYNENKNIPTQDVEPKAELRGFLAHDSLYSKESPVLEEQQKTNNVINFELAGQNIKEQQRQISYTDSTKSAPLENMESQKENNNKMSQEDSVQKESEWEFFRPDYANQEQTIDEQLQQHWTRILDHNRAQFKGLSTTQNKNQYSQASQQTESSQVENAAMPESESKEKQKSEIEKQIEAILRDNRAFEGVTHGFSQSEPSKHSPPIIIQREVSVTRHLPVHVLKHVKVPVPTPVLVPVPEPYEVKVPHPYPVPREIVKHIPVPVVKHY